MSFFHTLGTWALDHMSLLLIGTLLCGTLTYFSVKRWLMNFSDEDEHIHHGVGYFMSWLAGNVILILITLTSGITFLLLLIRT